MSVNCFSVPSCLLIWVTLDRCKSWSDVVEDPVKLLEDVTVASGVDVSVFRERRISHLTSQQIRGSPELH